MSLQSPWSPEFKTKPLAQVMAFPHPELKKDADMTQQELATLVKVSGVANVNLFTD